jgi:prevent-host-death family protein
MEDISVTELRQNLATYLARVQNGEEVVVTAHGKIVARLVPEQDRRENAKKRLRALHGKARIGDVVSPIELTWKAQRGRA